MPKEPSDRQLRDLAEQVDWNLLAAAEGAEYLDKRKRPPQPKAVSNTDSSQSGTHQK